jgi:Tfp pilus assembly protein PilF
VPLLAQVRIGESQSASRQGAMSSALADARAAVRVQPWASTPYLQLALVYEQNGALSSARSAIEQALARDPGGWQLALVSARLETEQGDIAAARKEYARARALNPRSPLFAAAPG